jgi:streptomycin 6-kinase
MMEQSTPPAHFASTIVELYGAAGREWLDHLPALLGACAERWALRVLPPFPDLSYNYVAPAVRADGTAVVLKVGVPNPELLTEIAALQLYDGHGAARLFDAEPAWAALLLERLQPGEPLARLAEHDDEQATSIAAGVMRQLWRPLPPGHSFPTLARWTASIGRLRQRFGGTTGPLPARLVETAEELLSGLLASQAEPVLLHGDLHHMNILHAEREPWLALDPKGVAGEPAYEVGTFLYNPLPGIASWPNLRQVLARRVAVLAAALGFDRERLAAWGVVTAVLSACWSVEDEGHGWEPVLVCAEALVEM